MPNGQRPISAVLSDIVGNLQHIVRSEMRMAKTEIGEGLAKSRTAAIWMAAGLLLVSASVVFALLAIVYALSNVVPAWMAALIVAGGAGLLAAACVALGVQRFRRVRAAPKTADTLKEDVEWAKQLTR